MARHDLRMDANMVKIYQNMVNIVPKSSKLFETHSYDSYGNRMTSKSISMHTIPSRDLQPFFHHIFQCVAHPSTEPKVASSPILTWSHFGERGKCGNVKLKKCWTCWKMFKKKMHVYKFNYTASQVLQHTHARTCQDGSWRRNIPCKITRTWVVQCTTFYETKKPSATLSYRAGHFFSFASKSRTYELSWIIHLEDVWHEPY